MLLNFWIVCSPIFFKKRRKRQEKKAHTKRDLSSILRNLNCTGGKNNGWRTSLVVEWLGILLPMQVTQVWSLVWEDPMCHGAAKPVHRNCWACALEPRNHNSWAWVPQLLKLVCPRAHAPRQEKPPQQEAHAPQLESSPRAPKLEKSPCSNQGPAQPKVNT